MDYFSGNRFILYQCVYEFSDPKGGIGDSYLYQASDVEDLPLHAELCGCFCDVWTESYSLDYSPAFNSFALFCSHLATSS